MKTCDICGELYDESYDSCPKCSSIVNKLDLVDLSELKETSNKSNGSIIFGEEDKLVEKEELINKRNQSIKNNKKKSSGKFYSYLLLVMAMILLFIILFSSILDFNIIPFAHYILTVVLLSISFGLTYNEKEIGYYLGIASSFFMILMIAEGDYISSLIGIYIFTSSFRYLIKK